MNANLRNWMKLFLATLGLLATLVVLEAILTNHNVRWDMTPEKKFTLSDHARRVISGLTRDVHVTAMLRSDRPENPFIEDLLWRMASLSPHFSYTLVDMNRSPAVARQYGVNAYGTFVVEGGGRRRDASFSAGESDLVFAILQVSRDRPKVVYFLTGHGEKDLYDERPEEGFTKLKLAITEDFYEVRLLPLAQVGEVPQDASVVVICGPKEDYTQAEIAALDAYVRRGGSLLVLLDPGDFPRLAAFLQEYGFELPPLIVADPEKRLFAGEDLTFKVSAPALIHPILNGVVAPPVFSLARVVEARPDGARGIVAQPILASSGRSWATPDTDVAKKGQALFEEGRDRPGPLPLGGEVVVPVQGPSASKRPSEKQYGRIVVYGDSDFTSNFLIQHQGNKDLAVNTINWLAEDLGQIAARPQSQEMGRHQFFMSARQGQVVLVLSTVVMPGTVLVVGLGFFFWRKLQG